MDISDMTPKQLRQYALEKERAHDDLVSRYMDVPASQRFEVLDRVEPEPWERRVEFEGETYLVDMRRTKSREFVRLVAAMQDAAAAAEDGSAPISAVLNVYDYLFGGKVDEKVSAIVCAKLGYEDFEEIMRVEGALFEAVGAKN